MPDQGSSDAADVLRPSRRSLRPLANFEPDRERVRAVRHRTVRMKGALSQDTARLMVFKLVMRRQGPGDDCKVKTSCRKSSTV